MTDSNILPDSGQPQGGIKRTFLGKLRRRRIAPYGAGPRLDQAMDVCRRLERSGISSTIGYAARPGESPRSVTDVVLEAFDRLGSEDLDCYISVKLSRISFDPGLFAELKAGAAKSARRLHIDGLGPEVVETTLKLLENTPGAGLVGATLPARWRRSVDDIKRMTALDLRLRVVKGQWLRVEDESIEPRMGFMNVVDHLAGYQGGVAVATHDVGLLTKALERLTTSGTPCETELFLGMPFRGPARTSRAVGVPIRIYVPFGDTGAPYQLRTLVKKPAAMLWLIEDLAFGRAKMWRGIDRSDATR